MTPYFSHIVLLGRRGEGDRSATYRCRYGPFSLDAPAFNGFLTAIAPLAVRDDAHPHYLTCPVISACPAFVLREWNGGEAPSMECSDKPRLLVGMVHEGAVEPCTRFTLHYSIHQYASAVSCEPSKCTMGQCRSTVKDVGPKYKQVHSTTVVIP